MHRVIDAVTGDLGRYEFNTAVAGCASSPTPSTSRSPWRRPAGRRRGDRHPVEAARSDGAALRRRDLGTSQRRACSRTGLAARRPVAPNRGPGDAGHPGERQAPGPDHGLPSISEDEAIALALASAAVAAYLNGESPRRVIALPPKLVNIVI